MAFRFRQFSCEDAQSTLRIGTDSMLLGSWANPGKAKKILDIGTGCGVLALMMAQKSESMIDAIDIDQPSVLEAQNNFLSSPWPLRIKAMHCSLETFSSETKETYCFIISNPPYFANSLKSPSARINHTRHDEGLSLPELAVIVSRLLAADGCFATILPPGPMEKFQLVCAENGLFPFRSLDIFPKPASPKKRVLTEFTKKKITHIESQELVILDTSGKFTPEYLALTKCFHNF